MTKSKLSEIRRKPEADFEEAWAETSQLPGDNLGRKRQSLPKLGTAKPRPVQAKIMQN